MKRRSRPARGMLPLLATGLALALLAPAAWADAAGCAALKAPGLAATTVAEARFIAADAAKNIPAYCEVTATIGSENVIWTCGTRDKAPSGA